MYRLKSLIKFQGLVSVNSSSFVFHSLSLFNFKSYANVSATINPLLFKFGLFLSDDLLFSYSFFLKLFPIDIKLFMTSLYWATQVQRLGFA